MGGADDQQARARGARASTVTPLGAERIIDWAMRGAVYRSR